MGRKTLATEANPVHWNFMSGLPPHSETLTLPDLSVCAQEPIHIPGSIEPNGVLLAIKEPELTIVQASANTEVLLEKNAEALLGLPLIEVFEPESFEFLQLRISSDHRQGKRQYLSDMRLRGLTQRFDASVHRYHGVLILELEPAAAKTDGDAHVALHTSLADAMSSLTGRLSLSELCQRVATHVRALTGFDRVMIYRFLKDDTGWVIAEAMRDDLKPYLGLRYPASDIPAQARLLYLSNTLRLKADVNARRSPLVPELNPIAGQPLDMSHCVLRAMSPVHDEYLRNMDVTASMSVSIVKDERLWGLIACHHSTPKTVPHPVRISCELLSQVFSSHIAAAELEDTQRQAASSVEFRQELSECLRAQSKVLNALTTEGDRLASVINSEGVVICIGEEIALIGATPPRNDVERLLQWLATNQDRYLYFTDKLSDEYPAGAEFSDTASGLLSARIAMAGRDFILWFRPPAIKVIEWAGNPAKPVSATEAGRRISPRLSFELWKETIGDRSEPWQDHELDFAIDLRQTIAEELLVQRNEEILRLNHELERSNIELDAFAYAASHDLQEPVRTVRAYAQLLARRSGPKLDDEARDLIKVIENGAARMGNLISALLTYGQVGGSSLRERKPVNFDDALRVACSNLAESIRVSEAAITHDPLPTLIADQDQMIQLFQNLVGNSIKYRKPDEPPRIHVSATQQERKWLFSVRDNGQGLKPEETSLIFGVFKRLHGRDVPGTGIGLALCRRIVEHHGGQIWAESEGRGQGATFSFTLPQL